MSRICQFDAAAFCIIDNSRLLLVRSRGKNAFYLPGGKIEPDETFKDAVCRELKEELSIDLDALTLSVYGIFTAQAYGEPDGTTVVLRCFIGNYTGKIQAASEIADIRFFTYDTYMAMCETAPAVVLLMTKLRAEGRIV